MRQVAYLGPPGTFTEEALLTQPDLAVVDHLLCRSIPDVLGAAADGRADLGFTAIENSIEGTVNVALDALIFEHDLLIQREVVIDVRLHLLGFSSTSLDKIRRVISFPVATAQCRRYLTRICPCRGNRRQLHCRGGPRSRRLQRRNHCGHRHRLSQEIYGLDMIATDIEDHPENQTRFVGVSRSGVPAPTGNDKTSIVVFQHADRSGSLMGILAEFAARS